MACAAPRLPVSVDLDNICDAVMSLTDDIRSFNRFYTREIGLLNRRLPGGEASLPEARML